MTRAQPNTDDLLLLVAMRKMVREGTVDEARKAVDMSQAEMAGVVGVSRAAICRWEAGDRIPRGAHALKYAKVLNVLTRAAA